MNHRASDVVAVAAAAALAMTLSQLPGVEGALRLFFALPLVLALPGYALLAALLPGRELGAAERVALSLGLSLAAAALGGLALNWAPAGLSAAAWSALLGNVTLVACLVALARRWRRPDGAPRPAVTLGQGQALALGAAALLACGALLVAHDGAQARSQAGFTQLWALPDGAAGAVRLGVASMEPGTVRYRLQLEAGGEVVSSWPAIVLGREQRWEEQVALPAGQRGAEVEAVLYRLDAPGAPYRRVTLPAAGAGSDGGGE